MEEREPGGEYGALYPARTWRNGDTQALLGLSTATLAGAAVGYHLGGHWALLVPLVILGLGLAVVILTAHRLLLYRMEKERREAQAIGFLHTSLPVRAALPPMAGWAASPELAAAIVDLVLVRKPQHVVELGSGVSTLCCAYALERVGRGRITSLDHDKKYGEETQRQIAEHGLSDIASVLHAPIEGGEHGLWYGTSGLPDGPIDLLVIDGPPSALASEARYPAVPTLWERLAADAVIVVDDARRPDEQSMVARWRREHPELFSRWIDSEKGICVLYRTT